MKKNRTPPQFIGAKQLYMGHEMTMKQNAIRKKKRYANPPPSLNDSNPLPI